MEGIIPLWKPRGMTSHDCVFQLRKILQTRKVGHSGTLDPDVDGILPICVGRATKVVEYLQDSDKVYQGEITLGFSTETEDKSGAIVEKTLIAEPFSEKEIDAAMASFVGEIKQQPPMYSAVKVNGRRLYDYARAGEVVERPIRIAQIKEYRRTSEAVYHAETKTQTWRFEVTCGKGTYVRTLAVDTGKALGVAAHMSDLTRLKSGGFSVSEAVTIASLREAVEKGNVETYFFPLEYGVRSFESLELSDKQYQEIKNGLVVSEDYFGSEIKDWPRLLLYRQHAISIYGLHPTKKGMLKPVKVFRND